MPSLNLPGIQTGGVNSANLKTDPSQVYSLLAQAPQSLTATLGPLLQQVFGMQGNLMQPIFQQQGVQGAAQAQSDAMKRGLTGSSIESAGIGQAYAAANQGYDQYLAQQLSSLVPTYAGAAGQDISNQQQYYSNLAQAVGQQLSSQLAQQQFQQQLSEGGYQASQNRLAGQQQAIMGGLFGLGGTLGGSAIKAGLFSDIRLKKKLFPIAKWKDMTIFLFEYSDDKIKDLPKGPRVGFLAHEVAKYRPDCVRVDQGYLKVDYVKLFGTPKQMEVA